MGVIDNIIALVSPRAAFQRAQYKLMTEVISKRRYEAAAGGRRTSGWTTYNTSSNQEIEGALHRLRTRSRDLVRNNPYAFRAVQAIANNTVGTGIRPAIVSQSASTKNNVKRLWESWAGSTDCDFDGVKTFYGLQKLVMRTVAESGECLIVRRRNSNKEIPFEIQVLEPEYLDTTRNTAAVEGEVHIIMGVEFDRAGRRVAYWLYDKHPNDYAFAKSRRIPIEDVIHVYEVLRPGQVRGVPFGVSSFLRLKDFDEYEDAQLMRQKIAACFTAFVSSPSMSAGLPGTSKEADLTERVEPGLIQRLSPGDEVTFGNPPGAEGYESYSKKILQGISVGYGTTYEILSGDLSNVNFSSGRMGWIEFQRNVEDWQEFMLVPQFCNKTWEWFLQAAFLAGKIRTMNISASWTPPRREMIDPFKETKAMIEQVKAGFISWPEALRLMGYDPDMTMAEIEQWMKDVDTKGLKLSTDARNDMKPSDNNVQNDMNAN